MSPGYDTIYDRCNAPVVRLGKDRLRRIISDELVHYFDGSDSVAGVVITEGEVNHLVAAIFDRISHETGD